MMANLGLVRKKFINLEIIECFVVGYFEEVFIRSIQHSGKK